MELELLKLLEKRYNFKTVFVDGYQQWGMKVNGTWTGVVGQVYYGVTTLFYTFFNNKNKQMI